MRESSALAATVLCVGALHASAALVTISAWPRDTPASASVAAVPEAQGVE